MKNVPFWAGMNDKGGTLGALPVVQELTKRGYAIRVLAHPQSAAATVLHQNNVQFDAVQSVEDAIHGYDVPKVMVVAMDPGPFVTRDLTAHLRLNGNCNVIGLSDFPSARIRQTWGESRFRPHYAVVNDTMGSKILSESWPEFPSNRIWVTGFPALDRLVDYDITVASGEVRKTFGIPKALPIVLFGDPAEGGGYAFREIVRASNTLRRDICLIARLRPDTPTRLAKEMPIYEEAFREFHYGQLIKDSSRIQDTLKLIAAATVTISTYSTMLQEAAALHLPNIAILDNIQMPIFRHYVEMEELHLVTMGCTSKATNTHELATLMDLALQNQLQLPLQKKHFLLDGKNTERVVNKILLHTAL